MVKKLNAIGIVCILILIVFSGCTDNPSKKNENIEEDYPKDGDVDYSYEQVFDGIYNPTVQYGKIYLNGTWHNITNIKYVKDDVSYENLAFIEYALDVFEWMKNNTIEDSTVLCWWDYGGMVEAFGERNSIVVYPSLSLKNTIGSFNIMDKESQIRYINENEWSNNDTIMEVASVLTSENILDEKIQNILKIYNVSYIFTRSYDKYIAEIIYNASGKNSAEYISDDNVPTEKGNATLIFKMWEENPVIEGLEFVYYYYPAGYYHQGDSINFRIFKLVNETT